MCCVGCVVVFSSLLFSFPSHPPTPTQTTTGRYTIWIVPPEVTSYPQQVQADDAVLMKWGASLFNNGKTVDYPGLLYRQVMAQSQVVQGTYPPTHPQPIYPPTHPPTHTTGEGHPLHPSGVVNIVPEFCAPGQPGPHAPGAQEAIQRGDLKAMEDYCCSKDAALECFMPDFVEYRYVQPTHLSTHSFTSTLYASIFTHPPTYLPYPHTAWGHITPRWSTSKEDLTRRH